MSSYVNMPAANGSIDMDKMAAVVPVPKQQEVLDLKKCSGLPKTINSGT